MPETLNVRMLDVEGAPWPTGWRVARNDSGVGVDIDQSIADKGIALACGILIAIAFVADWVIGGPFGRFKGTGERLANPDFIIEILFPPWQDPTSGDRYLALLLNVMVLVVLAAAIWCLFGKTTYYFSANKCSRQRKIFGWSRAKTITDGRINLNVLYEDKNAPEQSIWSWELEVRASRKNHFTIDKLSDGTRGNNYLSMARAKELGQALSQITGWPFLTDLTNEMRPEPSISSSTT